MRGLLYLQPCISTISSFTRSLFRLFRQKCTLFSSPVFHEEGFPYWKLEVGVRISNKFSWRFHKIHTLFSTVIFTYCNMGGFGIILRLTPRNSKSCNSNSRLTRVLFQVQSWCLTFQVYKYKASVCMIKIIPALLLTCDSLNLTSTKL